jgi:hypothetical protein
MMLNDPTVLEASRVLAQNLLAEKSSNDQKIAKAFRLIVCRNASGKEMDILDAYFKEQLEQFSQKKLDAAGTIKTGEYKMPINPDTNSMAALMKTIQAIYNLEESITKT